MKFRLNGWHAAGIALSLFWIFAGAGYWSSGVNENAWAHAEQTFVACRSGQPRNGDFNACLEEMQDDYDAYADPQPRWEPLAERALLPPALAWLGVCGLIAIHRRRKRKFGKAG